MTEDSAVPEQFEIKSHKGLYVVTFQEQIDDVCNDLIDPLAHYLIDANVARLHAEPLAPILKSPNSIIIEATEKNKSIERIIPIVEQLVENQARRDHTLVAIGGGIIQDITCFIASNLLRGMDWKFVPTTLLAQADSCIGSKSSINLGKVKNILGTFNPPQSINIFTTFLSTLDKQEIYSGVGEMIKVHAIDGGEAFDRLASDYDDILADNALMAEYIHSALLIKRRFIEVDEFDQGVRNVFNYGHSFGHAIEAATDFGVPHGIAVTMGMELANHMAVLRGLTDMSHYLRMQPVIVKNYVSHAATPIPRDDMLSALMKDKKNTSDKLVLIMPVGDRASIKKIEVTPDDTFRAQFNQCLEEMPV